MVEWFFDTRDARAARDARVDFANYVNRFYGPQADVMAAELVLGELIGNVVRHAPGPTQVKVSFDDRGVTIAVQDHGNGFSASRTDREIALLSESGRGLAIVSQLADQVEIECDEADGCCVRARLELVAQG